MTDVMHSDSAVEKNRKFIFIPSVVILVFIGLLIFAIWSQVFLQWEHRFRFPWADFAAVTKALDANPTPTLADLYKMLSFNEHRIVIAYYFYLLDRNYFESSSNFLFFAIYFFNMTLVASLLWPVLYMRRKFSALHLTLFAISVIYWFFAAFNWENLTFQIQVCQTGCLAFLSLGSLIASQVSVFNDSERSAGRDSLLAAITGVAGLLATYFFGAGLIIWPLIFAHAIVTRWRPGPLIIFGAFGVFAIGTYAYWYLAIANFEGEAFHTPFGSAVSHPMRLAIFVLNVLAWPPSLMFEGILPPRLGRWIMIAVSLAGCAVAFVRIFLIYVGSLGFVPRPRVSPVLFFAAMLVVSALGMSLLAGIIRSGAMSGFGRSSYGVMGSIFWCGLLVLLLLDLQSDLARKCLVGFAIVTVFMAYTPWRLYEQNITERDQKMYQAGVLATFGLDLAQMPSLSVRDPIAMWRWPRSGGSYAEREPFKWIGHSLADLPRSLAADHCIGQADSVRVLEGEPTILTVGGWSVISASDNRVHWVLLADDNDFVVGAGKPGLASPDVPGHLEGTAVITPARATSHARFEIAAVADPGKPLFLWIVDSHGKACRVGHVMRD